MTDDNLTDVFDDSNDSTPAKDEVVETKGEPKTDDKSETAKVEDKAEADKDAEPPAAENKDELWTKKAVLDERKKRQALEVEIAKLKEAKKPEEDKTETAELTKEELTMQSLILRERISLSREMMLEKHEDYEELETVFMDMAKENPSLVTQMNASPNPAKFAYNQAKAHSETKKLSDPEYVQKMKEDMRKEILAELEAKQTPEDKRKKTALSVANISKATSVSSNSSKESLETLDDMFDD